MLNEDYFVRQKKLLRILDKNSLAILVAAPEVTRNGDATYLYRQQSDFYYLTGFSEPDAIAVFAPGSDLGDYILFNRPKDKAKEIWEGTIVGQEDACQYYGANSSFPIAELENYLTKIMMGRDTIYYEYGNHEFDSQLFQMLTKLKKQVRSGMKAPTNISSLEKIIHEFRLIKSDYELSLMRYAVDVSVAAHKKAMQCCKPGLKEYNLAAEIHYEFQKHGCHTPAYNTIVGSGKNACTLHYIENKDELKSGDLVLIDAGAEYQNYAADITRTFPVNGKFSGPQKQIYELVLEAQKAAMNMAKPGVLFDAMQQEILQTLTSGLIDLGILRGDISNLIETKAYFPFYMHKSGHWLGMDVHDVGAYKIDNYWRPLQPGMVLTIEPGLYIPAGMNNVPEHWWNIGVRIEDDVLITTTGHEVLSQELPTTVVDIQALMQA